MFLHWAYDNMIITLQNNTDAARTKDVAPTGCRRQCCVEHTTRRAAVAFAINDEHRNAKQRRHARQAQHVSHHSRLLRSESTHAN
jgi:hypothetical protein